MVSFFRTFFSPPTRRDSVIILAFVLLVGFSFGAFFAVLSAQSSLSLMRMVLSGHVSIVSLLSASLLPFLLTALAVFTANHWLLIPIAFFKAFSLSYLSTVIIALFRNSGWLIQLLLMFTDCLSFPVLCWLWIRIFSGRRILNLRCLGAVSAVVFGIICLDYRFISPFLVNLLS